MDGVLGRASESLRCFFVNGQLVPTNDAFVGMSSCPVDVPWLPALASAWDDSTRLYQQIAQCLAPKVSVYVLHVHVQRANAPGAPLANWFALLQCLLPKPAPPAAAPPNIARAECTRSPYFSHTTAVSMRRMVRTDTLPPSLPLLLPDALLSLRAIAQVDQKYLVCVCAAQQQRSAEELSMCTAACAAWIAETERPMPMEYADTPISALRSMPPALQQALASSACHTAIRFHQPLAHEQMERLLHQWTEVAFPFQCAHGRPSAVCVWRAWRPAPRSRPVRWERLASMDLTNLRESLEVSGEQSPAALCHDHDERLTDEFRVAALQLTNLYKQGRQNTHKAFVDGYTKALCDTIECLAQESPLEAQTRLDRLRSYLLRRLETLQSDAQEHEEASESKSAHAASPCARPRRPLNERRTEGHRSPPGTQEVKPKTPHARHEHSRRTAYTDAPPSEESEDFTTAVAPATPAADRPRKRRRPVSSMHTRPHDRFLGVATRGIAMQYVGKLVSSVYNTITPNINPSTLTGAIDVIVVEREVEVDETTTLQDGTQTTTKRRTTELSSSPFHVRFGKMSVLRPAERKVTLHLNDSPDPLPFAMKVGENGEAFFVMKLENAQSDVPEDLVTSPMVHASEIEKPGDPEPLDLGAAEASAPGSATPPTNEADKNVNVTVPNVGDPSVLDLDMEGYKVSDLKRELALKQGQRFANEMPLRQRHGGNNLFSVSERLDQPQLHWQQEFLARFQSQGRRVGALRRRSSDASVRDSIVRQERPRIPVSVSDTALSLIGVREAFEHEPVASGLYLQEPDAIDTQTEDEGEFGTLTCAEADPYLFQLQIDDSTVYTFELSLCLCLPQASEMDCERMFDEGRISFQRFLEDKSMADDARLCLRHKDTYHWRATEPDMFTTLLLYREALLRSTDEKPKATAKASVWRRLWGKDAAAPPTSAPVPVSADSPAEPVPSSAPTTPVSSDSESESETPLPETYVKTLRLSSDQLKQLGLRKGTNTITFSVTSSYSGVATCRAHIFLWDCEKPVVVSDIDGTITKSDALGHVFTLMGRDWTHLGVAKLYHDIAQNGYRLMYLTSRAIGQADITRDYLRNINQNNYQLPDGPVIMSPDRLMASLHREVILRKPEVFKMACLRDIARLFGVDPAHPDEDHSTPFYAGFGNRITDALSYRSVNIPSSRIFTIDSNGQVKMELLELAGYNTSYPNMTDLVDQMFPPIATKKRSEKSAAFSDFNFWRDDVPTDVELPPLEDLVPPVQPTSPSLRGLRSPKQTAVSVPMRSQTEGPPTANDTPKPSRLRRLLGLRRKDKRETTPGTQSPEMQVRSFDLSDGSLSPPSGMSLSLSPSSPGWDRHILTYDDPEDMHGAEEPDDEHLESEAYTPAARRRLERRYRLLYGSSSLSLDDGERRERSMPDSAQAAPEPENEDPLLESGDIQFEWQG
ncbi:phosphatidate phosphatase [Malassezia caprae]|uniref:phosphatidate phosphatase n=1 Tax=Malassezia caprae TaxID=1381934 RepID=A0AAF0E7N5_9BASI|nr:phosphatidate phosphatase [Malassezia caprae]